MERPEIGDTKDSPFDRAQEGPGQGEEPSVNANGQQEEIGQVSTVLPRFYGSKANNDNNDKDNDDNDDNENSVVSVVDYDDDGTDDSSSVMVQSDRSGGDEVDSLPSTQHSRRPSVSSIDSAGAGIASPNGRLRTPVPKRSNLLSPSSFFSPSPANATGSDTPEGSLHTMDRRFKTRLNQLMEIHQRAHKRDTSTGHYSVATSDSDILEPSNGSEIVRWAKLRKLSSQLYSESTVGARGMPTVVLPAAAIIVGTSHGIALVFDHNQNLRHAIGEKYKATSSLGSVTSLALTADQTFVALGYSSGHITVWDLAKNTSSPILHISPIKKEALQDSQSASGHLERCSIIHLGFGGKSHRSIISGDANGVVFAHKAVRSFVGYSVRTVRVLGRYYLKPKRPTSLLAMSTLPLGTLAQVTDELNIVAVMTPHTMAIISTVPFPQTEFKVNKPKSISTVTGLSGCMAWYPAMRMGRVASAVPKLAYCWSNVLTIIELHSRRDPVTDGPNLSFKYKGQYTGEETFVAVQWINGQTAILVTITQRLIILNTANMTVAGVVDLLDKHVMHMDYFSGVLRDLSTTHHDEEEAQPLVVADAFYNSIRVYKGRVFLLGNYEFVVGSLTNWADRLLDVMETGDYVRAIQLATGYYLGQEDPVTLGLPSNPQERKTVVKGNLQDMILASLKYTLHPETTRDSPKRDFVAEVLDACFAACDAVEFGDNLGKIYECFESSEVKPVFFEKLESYILDGTVNSLPPDLLKELISYYAESMDGTNVLEQIICSLDTSTLDLDMTLGLCVKYHLREAYAYIWNWAFLDFVGPLAEFILMIRHVTEVNGYSDVVEKERLVEEAEPVFPYLSYILTGRVYPTGLLISDENQAIEARKQVFNFLLSPEPASFPELPSNETIEKTRSMDSEYPYIHALLGFDSASFFAAMNEAFEDPFLNDDESGTSVNRQLIMNILMELLRKEQRIGEAKFYLNLFIARNYPKYTQFLILPGSILSQVLEELCYQAQGDTKVEAELAIESLLSAYKPPNLDTLTRLLYEMKIYSVLQFIFRTEKRYASYLQVTLDWYKDDKSAGKGFEVIRVLKDCLFHTQKKKARDHTAIEDLVTKDFELLASIDPERFAEIVHKHLPHLQEKIFDLTSNDDLQYYYLRRLFGLINEGDANLPTIATRNRYLVLLAKRRQSDEMHKLLQNVFTGENDVSLPAVVDDLIDNEAVDILAILLQRQHRYSEAMIYLIDQILVLNSKYDGNDDSSTESKESVGEELERHVKISVSICQEAEDYLSDESKHDSLNDRASMVGDDRPMQEKLWTRLLETLVDIKTSSDDGLKTDLLQSSLTALIEHVGSGPARTEHNSVLLNVFRAILYPKKSKKARDIGTSRPIFNELFSAFNYQYTMLEVAKQLLDKDSFQTMMELIEIRKMGWRSSRSGECEGCGLKVTGVGIDAEWLYSAWEQWIERKAIKDLSKAFSSDNDEGLLMVFNCGHSFHVRCLKNFGIRSKNDLKCLVCDSNE